MNHWSKFVAVLALLGVVISPTSVLFAHSECIAHPKDVTHGCHSMAARQSGSRCYTQAADHSCCQAVPALPMKTTTCGVVILTALPGPSNLASLSLPTHDSGVGAMTFVHPPAHCRPQAVLCSFLI